MRIDFEWDPAKAASNAAKHGVTFETSMAVFRDPLALSMPDLDNRQGDERWITLGETAVGQLVLVVHTWIDIDP
ncbi:MAG: BrnT family toxin [Xanthobacteraceae bacterium]